MTAKKDDPATTPAEPAPHSGTGFLRQRGESLPTSPDADVDAEVYRIKTTPPPPGEADAYNAPTRVGAGMESVLEEMKRASERGLPLKPLELPRISAPPASAPRAKAAPVERVEMNGEVALLRHEEDEEFELARTVHVSVPTDGASPNLAPALTALPWPSAPPPPPSVNPPLLTTLVRREPDRRQGAVRAMVALVLLLGGIGFVLTVLLGH